MPNDPKVRIDAEELRSLGFSEGLIAEAIARQEAGVMDYPPPPDLHERTLAACEEAYPELFAQAEAASDLPVHSLPALGWTALKAAWRHAETTGALDLPALARLARAALGTPGALPLRYTAGLDFALREHKRPLLIVENHNLIDPGWWDQDPSFRSLRHACGLINREVTARGIPPIARVIVLRPDESDYAPEDLQTLGRLLAEATSDVWFLPRAHAGDFADRDLAVIGDREILRIDRKASSPRAALAAARLVINPAQAMTTRRSFQHVLTASTPIKFRGQLVAEQLASRLSSAEGLRTFLGEVIRGRYAAPAIPPSAREGEGF